MDYLKTVIFSYLCTEESAGGAAHVLGKLRGVQRAGQEVGRARARTQQRRQRRGRRRAPAVAGRVRAAHAEPVHQLDRLAEYWLWRHTCVISDEYLLPFNIHNIITFLHQIMCCLA